MLVAPKSEFEIIVLRQVIVTVSGSVKSYSFIVTSIEAYPNTMYVLW